MKILRWSSRSELMILILILALALCLRLYHIENPLLDWHAFRQADTASVTRHYVQHGINLLEPKYDDISSIPSGLENPNGYRMVEFPLINALLALILRNLPWLDLTVASRMASVLFSLGSIILLFLMVRSISTNVIALASALALAVLPYNVYYSRVVLPEPFFVFALLATLCCWWYYLHNPSSSRWLLLLGALISLSLALLMKPFAIFIYPVIFAMSLTRNGWNTWKNWSMWVVFVLPLAPFFAWRNWIQQFPEGIPANMWLLNGNDIRLKPSWFRWLFYERLIRLMLGITGAVFLIASLFRLSRAELLVYGSWWAGMIAYLVVFATGNVQHDYYQAMLAPIIAITLGRGVVSLFHQLQKGLTTKQRWVLIIGLMAVVLYGLTLVAGIQQSAFYPERLANDWIISTVIIFSFCVFLFAQKSQPLNRRVAGILTAILVITSLLLSSRYVLEYYKINHWEYLHVGQALRELLPSDAKVIAPANGDTMFLFQINRPGWPLGYNIAEKIQHGATHYVSTARDDETASLSAEFRVVVQNDLYTLIDLSQPQASNSSRVNTLLPSDIEQEDASPFKTVN